MTEHAPSAEPDRRCAVLGSPIAHSLSPVIHRAAYRHLGLNWRYDAYEVREAELASFLSGLTAAWRGLSLTMPLKRVALELADEASDLARTVGAANTIVREDDGRLIADNTDVPGLVATVAERDADVAGPVCLWGGGATAASVLAALAFMGSGAVHVHVRSADRAEAALAVAAALGHPARPVAWSVLPVCRDAGLVVGTAPPYALDGVSTELAGGDLTGRVLLDVVYDPWPTVTAQTWRRNGGAVASGLDLLVHQAIGQLKLMTGRDVPVGVLRDALVGAGIAAAAADHADRLDAT